MALTAKGLIVKENPVGEADRFVTVLTDQYGIIRASVRGARRINSRAGAATRLLSYARLSLVKGRDKFIVDTAIPERVFFATGGSVEQLALAQYFCELFAAMSPREEEAAPFLQLLLNTLHLLERGDDLDRVKAVAEWRLMAMAGYEPDIHRCRCGEGMGTLWFHPLSGTLGCDRCRENGGLAVSRSVYDAMRHVLYGDKARAFAFRLPKAETAAFAAAAEAFVLCHAARRFQTLEFYHSLSSMNPEV